MMTRAAVLIIVGVLATACRTTAPQPPPWEVGYWYWQSSPPEARPAPSEVTPDILYVQVGMFSRSGVGGSHWPSAVPHAKSYVATWRSAEPRVPERPLIAALSDAYRQIQVEAARSGQRIAGLQLDIDCPTGSLRAYGDFLRQLRRALGSDARLSITALLDWFREGTQVRQLVQAVDEYVPQFYDAGSSGPGARIAEPIAVDRWAARLNDLGTPYRLGVSAFGRIQRVRSRTDGGDVREVFRDVTLLQLWSRPLGAPQVETSESGERVLRWRVGREVPPVLQAGDGVEAIIPTPASIRTAYAAARRFGGFCSGVVFFRWPAPGETLAMTPHEIRDALVGTAIDPRPELRVADGHCLERICTDLSVRLHDRFPTQPIELRLEASTDVQYLMSVQPAVTMRQVGAREMVATIPAFLGEDQVFLGRAFSQQSNQYRIREREQ